MPTIAPSLLLVAAAGLLTGQAFAASAPQPPHCPDAAIAQADAVERYQVLAKNRARDYDAVQDIGPEQLLVLLDIAERTGYSLGQLLATGEHESAHTWNDFVRPPLGGGRVGAAAGVWQFQPKTFERVIHRYGEQLLALTDADPAAGRRRLDLGFGPFPDAHVRLVIRDTIDGLRDADDPELGLLRHDFPVLAVAKYLLSKDGGARDPVEDYLFHFLGAAEGRRILTLARGEARNTRTVQPPPPPGTGGQAIAARSAIQRGDNLPPRPRFRLELEPRGYRRPPSGRARLDAQPAAAVVRPLDVASLRMSAIARQLSTRAAPAWTAPDGYAYDSPIVTGNLKMFYRDGADRGDPYTWAEFLEHLARRVRADEQPRLVRAKYGVGFELAGGDMAQWAFDPARPGVTVTLHLDGGRRIEIPKAQLTAPLDDGEMHDYQRRLAALIGLGDAAPTAILSDAAATTLRRLGLLSIGSRGAADQNTATDDDLLAALGTDMGPGWGVVLSTGNARVRDALHAFRKLIGKAPPDDPAQADLLLPAERAALEVYGMRIERLVAAANGGDE